MRGPTLLLTHQLELACADDVGQVLVHVPQAVGQAGFHPKPEPFLQFPYKLRQNKALQGGFRGSVKSRSETVLGEPRSQRLRVLPKSQAADVVKSEPKQQILEINRLALELSLLQYRAKPQLNGAGDPASHGLTQSPGGEFQCGGLTLEPPRFAIRIEDPLTEQVMEHCLPCRTLGVIIEPDLENMLQILRVTRDGHETLLPG